MRSPLIDVASGRSLEVPILHHRYVGGFGVCATGVRLGNIREMRVYPFFLYSVRRPDLFGNGYYTVSKYTWPLLAKYDDDQLLKLSLTQVASPTWTQLRVLFDPGRLRISVTV